MKLFIKEIFYKLLMFTILSLIWFVFIRVIFFSDGVIGFTFFGITYILVEFINKLLKEKTKFYTSKIVFGISIGVVLIMFIGFAMATIDYDMALKGDEPVFTFKKEPIYNDFITSTDDGDIKCENKLAFTEYKGFGYKIIICSENVNCNEKVKILPFSLGAFAYSYPSDSTIEID